nr:UDP-glucuronate:xylan alpha-glucuronosyltransferase 2-like isoform X2 [Ipomoea batatas]
MNEVYDVSNLENTAMVAKKEAYATVLHSSQNYVCGAITLAQSLLRTGTKRDLILLLDSTIPETKREALAKAGWKLRFIKRIRNPRAEKKSYNEYNYSKLRLWQLTDYDKVIFVDSDVIVLRNIDFLFNFPEISAAGNDGSIFNSGVMVLEPSNCTFHLFMRRANDVVSYNGGDQGFLNEIFVWWHRLPRRVNFLKNFWSNSSAETTLKNHLFGSDPPELYAIHYLGVKPWLCYRDYDCNWDISDQRVYASDVAHRTWWKVHDAMDERLQKFCGLPDSRKIRLEKERKKARLMGFQDQHWKINVSAWFTFAVFGMEDARNTKENTPSESSSLSGVSVPNVQPNSESQMSQHINGNVTTEAQHSAVNSSKSEHLKEDSHGISPEGDYPSPAGNLVTTSVKTDDTENPEMPEPHRDERSATLSVSIPSSVLEAKPHTTSATPSVEHDVSPCSSSNSDALKLQHVKINESSESIPSKDSEIKGGYPNSTKNAIHTPASSPQVRHIESENHSLPSDNTGQRLARISTHFIKTPTPIHSKHPENAEKNKIIIDTAAPFRSVKQAVSKFGGIVDWKAHQAQSTERQKLTNQELEKVQQEIPLLKKKFEAAEDAKQSVLKELDSTTHLSRRDGARIADESSIAAKAQLEVARARHTAAVSELQTVTAELEKLRKDYAFLLYEKEIALKKAEEAVSSSKEVERTVEDLTIELITLKESLDAAHAAHSEAEERRIGATMATEQDTLQWEKEVKQAEDELAKLNQQAMYALDLKSKLDAANALLHDLRAELTAYMESKLEQEVDNDQNLVGELVEPGKRTHGEIQSAIESSRKELDEVKLNLEKQLLK